MTIRRGEDWGAVRPVPEDIEVFADDRALASALNRASPPTVVAVLGGDLHRTVSSSPNVAHYEAGTARTIVPVDLVRVSVEGAIRIAVSHLVARRSWWLGEILVVANAQFIGTWDVAPRSHPNDGWLDVSHVQACMSLRQRIAARPRLRTASHLPHPEIAVSRVRSGRWEFGRPLTVFADGQPIGRSDWLEVECLPDALQVCI